MNENQSGSNNLLDTTDCLEAVGVFKGWKNLFFVIIIICLLLTQISFWLVNIGWVPVPAGATMVTAGEEIMIMPITAGFEQNMAQDANEAVQEKETAAEPNQPAMAEKPATPNQPAEPVQAVKPIQPSVPEQSSVPNKPAVTTQPMKPNEPVMTAKTEPAGQEQSEEKITKTETPKPAPASEKEETSGSLFGITFNHLVWIIRFVNAVLILAATLYCLTILFSLKVSMLGRLGGINHITRAFFLSLLALVLLLPWQRVFPPVIIGAMYTPEELVKWFSTKSPDLFDSILYYLRFCGFWLLIILLMVLAQIRSSRWAGAIIRRLEII